MDRNQLQSQVALMRRSLIEQVQNPSVHRVLEIANNRFLLVVALEFKDKMLKRVMICVTFVGVNW